MPIDETELNQMEIKINALKQVKGPKILGTDKQEEFDGLIQQAEYHHWQLSQANKCAILLDEYYAYRNEAKKSANRRFWLTYFGFFFAYLIFFFCFARFVLNKDADFTESLAMLGALSIVALITAGIHFFINYYIFDHIDTSGIKNLVLVFLGGMAVYLILFIVIASSTIFKNAKVEQFVDALGNIIVFSGIASALHVWINNSIVYSLKKQDEDAYRKIKSLEDEIRCASNSIDTHRPITEIVPIWKASVYHCIDVLTKL